MGYTKRYRPISVANPPFTAASVAPIKEQLGIVAPGDDDDADAAGVSYYHRATLPTPTEDWLNLTVIRTVDRKTYICQNEPFLAANTTYSFASLFSAYMARDADLTVIHHQFPQLGLSDVGSYYFDTYDNTFYEAVETQSGSYDFRHVGAAKALREVCHAYFHQNEGGELPGDDDTVVIYLGEAHDDEGVIDTILPRHEAAHGAVDLTVEYYTYFNFITNQFEILTSYVPQGSLVDHFVWNAARAEAFHPIFRPVAGGLFPEPNEQLFREHAVMLDDNGHGWAVQSVPHPGEEERAHFAFFFSSPSDSAANRGREILPAWASGVAYQVGERVDVGTQDSVGVCLQDHTSTSAGATGNPDDENTGYEAYWSKTSFSIGRFSVPNRSHFRGVYANSSHVSSPQVGDWIAEVYQNTGVAFLRYSHTGGPLFGSTGWFTYHPYAHVLGSFQTEAAARRAIRDYDVTAVTVALINGQLARLTYFAERTPDTHGYEWVSSRPGQNPVAVFYGAAMTAAGGRWQEVDAGNKEDEGTADRLLRWHTTARESFFHGNALSFEFHAPGDVSGEDASVTNSDILFSPEPGLYHVELGAGSNSTDQADAALALYQVLSGTADDLARALVTPGNSDVASNLGEPDLEIAATASGRFVRVNEGDVFLGVFKGVGGNTSQYMLWEKLD